MPIAVSAVMFAYNEGAHLEAVVRESLTELARCTCDHELVLVDDGSTDDTPEILARLAAELPEHLVVVTHPENRGIGEAVHTGYARVSRDWVCILPADGQLTVAGYRALFDAAEKTGADLVLGRYVRRGAVDGLGRMVLSRGLRLMSWAVLGVGRRLDSAFLFRREWLRRVPLTTRTFFVNLELPIRIVREGGVVVEVPMPVYPRISGSSKVLKAGRIAGVARDVLLLRRALWRERLERLRAKRGLRG